MATAARPTPGNSPTATPIRWSRTRPVPTRRCSTDPTLAAGAGFDTPILHGLCTYGVTGRARLHAACDSDPARFAGMGGRFKSPVMPGEVLEVHIWDQGDEVLFQTRATGDRVVFDGGVLTRH